MFYLSRGEQVVLVMLLALLFAGAGTAAYVKVQHGRSPHEDPLLVPAPADGRDRPIVVRISGAVAQPGIHGLPGGARLGDAIGAAGGPTEQADLDGVDLSAAVQDGQQILVPYRVAATSTDTPSAWGAEARSTISLNHASQHELELLPGIGPIYAERIIAYRQRKMREEGKGFQSTDELLNIPGIGPKRFAAVKDLVAP